MSARTTRHRILEALQDLPADATVDDAIERLIFLEKVEAGLAELDDGKGIAHAEVKRRLGVWLGSSGHRSPFSTSNPPRR